MRDSMVKRHISAALPIVHATFCLRSSKRTVIICDSILKHQFPTNVYRDRSMRSITKLQRLALLLLMCVLSIATCNAKQPLQFNVWPDLAPGETTKNVGTKLPPRGDATITRVEKITQPTLDVFPAKKPNGTAVLILPGGGFRYVVPDLEGSESAAWLNERGVTAFVLRYRTAEGQGNENWLRPLQDSQRAIRLIRSESDKLKISPDKIGLFGFSAGGQVAAIHLAGADASYSSLDAVDTQPFAPNFGMLVYPWRIYDSATKSLMPQIQVSPDTPPAFIVHTDDDASSSLGAALFYAGLKQNRVSGELHIYQNGGHGYGSRDRKGSAIGTWKDRAIEWLEIRGLCD